MTGPKAPGIRHKPSSFGVWDLGFGLFSLLLYSLTLSKDILPADGGEFQGVGAASPPLVFLSRAVQRLTQSRLAGISSALALGFSTTFWAQATTANVRMLTALATALAPHLIPP